MGPSGSGKTSLLTAIAGRTSEGKVTGRTLINGVACDLNRYQRTIGFVPQEDVMFRDCTVKETLSFSASVRGDRNLSSGERLKIMRDTTAILGLEEISDSVIGDENVRGVSGGQRKRVNVGIEMIAQPNVLLLDEPTSGKTKFILYFVEKKLFFTRNHPQKDLIPEARWKLLVCCVV
jgi:ABC-type multidrug transport system ATPase subunit